MKNAWFLAAVVGLAGVGTPAAHADKKDPLPGKATWELRPLRQVFRIVKTDYDEGKKRVKWTVDTREGVRTSDFNRGLREQPFTFTFLDGEYRELAIIQLRAANFQGVPGTKIMKEGTRLTITLDVPKTIDRAKKVVLKRGKG